MEEKYGIGSHFKGWVPTVSGHLSFGSINLTGFPTKVFGANVEGNGERYIASWQRRGQSDSLLPLPEKIRKWFAFKRMREVSDFDYVCISHAYDSTDLNRKNHLHGSIFCLFPDNYRNKKNRNQRSIQQICEFTS